jgi:hypothetical protein
MGGMKFDFPPRAAHRDSAIRPGFDVLMAVTGARQAASPTARLVAARRCPASSAVNSASRAGLLATGRTGAEAATMAVARFADLALGADPERDSQATANQEMNSPFTRAFQPMVKHDDVEGPLNTGRPVGDGPGME